ncbi:MAG: helix-turn-helix domain-containing protein [Bryobacterales bacterium]|nr:helix-turn-helix domain-containing protein [Bryobacterales bacterium]
MQDNFLKRLGSQVREARKAQGFSQEGFADACSLHRTHISLLERGLIDVKIMTLKKVAGVLKVSLSELLRGLD